MPIYVMLMNLTDQGAKNIKEAPQRIKEGIKAHQDMGGKLLGFYVLMGEYDYLAIGEAPNDESALAFSMALSSQGSVRTTTLKAFTAEQVAGLVGKLP
jgi:uncharacterized protein with GYD domain